MTFFNRAVYPAVQLWTFALLFGTGTLFAQFEKLEESWRWVQFTTDIGLPSNRVFGVVETPSGKIWAATQSGLAWFDGYYWHAVGKDKGVPEVRAMVIVPDTAGQVLVLIGGRLFQGGENDFRQIPLTFRGQPMSISSLVHLPDQRNLLLSDSSLYVFKNDTVLPFVATSEVSRQRVIGVWITADGCLWINTLNGLYRGIENEWTKVLPASRRPLAVAQVVAGMEGRAIAYLMAPREQRGVWEFDPGRQPRHVFSDPTEFIQSMDVAPNGDAVLCIETGGLRIRRGSEWKSLSHPPGQIKNVLFVKFRSNGDLWVGSENALHLYRSSSKRWSYWVHNEVSGKNSINAILRTRDSSLWLARGMGLEVHKKDNTVAVFERIGNTTLNAVTGLAQDAAGCVWISSGSAFEGAYRWDGVAWEHFGAKEGLVARYIHRIAVDRKGRLWFLGIGGYDFGSGGDGTGPGAFTYDRGVFTKWGKEEGLLSGRVYAFVEGMQGEYWFGTDNGLSRWKSGQWTHWTLAQGLKINRVFTVAVDNHNQLWFGDQNNGVGNLVNDVPRYFTTADGLASNAVWDIGMGKDGRVWIATRGGLSSYWNGTWATFGISSGLSYSRLWPVLPEDDMVYVGTVGGGTAILDLEDAGKHDPVVVPAAPVVENGSVLLRWNAYSYFASVGQQDIETRFRTDQGAWSAWAKIREMTLTNLAPGEHKVTVQAKSEYGTYDSLGRSVSFSIPYPFYRHPTFFLPVSALSFGLVAVTIIYAARKKKYDAELRRTEARYRSVVEDQSEFIMRFLSDGRLTFVNKAYCLHYGKHPSDLIGSNFFTSVSVEDRVRIERKLSGLSPENPVATDEHRTVASNKGTRWHQWTDRATFDKRGRVVEFLAVGRDVTGYKEAEELVRASERNYKGLFNTVNDAIYILDSDGKFVDVNDGAVQMYGYPREYFVGKTPEFLSAPDRNDMAVTVEAIQQAFAGQPQQFEWWGLRKNGEIFPKTVRLKKGSYFGVDVIIALGLDITDRKRTEEALRASEKQFRRITENMRDVVLEADERGRFRYISPSFHAVLGYKESDFIGKPLFDLVHPGDYLRVKRQYLRGVLPREGGELEFRYRHLNGHYLHVSVTGTALVDDQKKPKGAVLNCRDITERKQSQERYRRIVEGTHAILFNTNPHGYFTYANEAACRLLELPLDQLQGRLFARWVHPDDRRRVMATYREQARTGIQSVATEFRYVSAGGREGWLSFLSNPVVRSDKVVEISGIAQDITERKRAEETLAEREKRYRVLFDLSPSGILLEDSSGTILDANVALCKSFSYSREELVGNNVSMLVPLEHRPDIEQHIAHILLGKKLEHEVDNVAKNGIVHRMELRETSIPLADGRVGILSVANDITDRKRIEAILHETNQTLEAFINASPLATVIVDPLGLIRLWNPAAENILGWKAEEVLGRPNPIVPPEKLEEYRALQKRITDGGETILGLEVTRMRKTGSPIQVSLSTAALHGNDGSVKGVMAILEDITERKRAEEALGRSEERLRLALKAANQGLYDLNVQTGEATVSSEYATMLGYDPATFRETNAAWIERLHSDDKEIVASAYRDYIAGNLTEYCVEFRQQTRSGEWKWILSIGKIVEYDSQGRPLRMLGTHTDITERKRAEEVLRQRNRFIEIILENAPIGFAVNRTDNGDVQFVSSRFEEIYGVPRGSLKSTESFFNEVYHDPETREQIHSRIISDVASGDPARMIWEDIPITTKDGRTKYVTASNIPLYEQNLMVSTVQDVTARWHAEEQIRASLREKEVLLKEIHHRVKNNLQVISSLLNLQSSYAKDKHSLELFKESQNRVKSMALIHEKLYQSRDFANIDFAVYVKNLTGFLYRSYVIDPNIVVLAVDIQEVQLNIDKAIPCGLIINELVSNSLKYAFPSNNSGRLFVGLTASDHSMLKLVISDNGVGLPAHINFRATESLGLQLVASLADQLGATVEVKSMGGTEYEISFPNLTSA